MRLLDTDVALDILRGNPVALDWLATLDDAPALPGPVVLELLTWQGLTTKKDQHALYDVLAEFEIYWPSHLGCDDILATVYQQSLKHTLLPADALLAACAIEFEATLCTLDPKRYKVFKDLATEKPYKPT